MNAAETDVRQLRWTGILELSGASESDTSIGGSSGENVCSSQEKQAQNGREASAAP
jgi:hypothetical protein